MALVSPASSHRDRERTLVRSVLDAGWTIAHVDATDPDGHRTDLLRLARAFGTVTATRGRQAIETLRPKAHADARPGSMSATYGLRAQPWHMDMAHRPLPARFVLLSCVDPGQQDCATELLDWRGLLDDEDMAIAAHEPMQVRSGRASFLTTVLGRDRRFLRHDPACMTALTDAGRALQAKIASTSRAPIHRMRWRPGRTLMFDNWRLLHRRADASHSGQRTLLRVSIME